IPVEITVSDFETGIPIRNVEYRLSSGGCQKNTSDGIIRMSVKETSPWELERGTSVGAEVSAQGYESAEIRKEVRIGDAEIIKHEIKLKKIQFIEGMVRDWGGNPAAGTTIMVTKHHLGDKAFYSAKIDYISALVPSVTTDDNGRYKIQSVSDGNAGVIAVHDNGIRLVSMAELQKSPDIRLEKWASISGTVMPGGKTISRATVQYNQDIGSEEHQGGISLHAVADSDGKFSFPKLPSGPYELSISSQNNEFSATWRGKLEGGEKKNLDIGKEKRDIVFGISIPESIKFPIDELLKLKPLNYSIRFLHPLKLKQMDTEARPEWCYSRWSENWEKWMNSVDEGMRECHLSGGKVSSGQNTFSVYSPGVYEIELGCDKRYVDDARIFEVDKVGDDLAPINIGTIRVSEFEYMTIIPDDAKALSGTIFLPDGNPAEGATVFIDRYFRAITRVDVDNPIDSIDLAEDTLQTRTDSGGNYQ
ncbi:MAG: carboxypeptidase-like regulatory domain-containing protein, partial [Rectinemataceae bacterium]|nr:carboxypeptidase-like regulatory domain-containing protein [Rectinemataceae bacterium]